MSDNIKARLEEWLKNMQNDVRLKSKIKCPECGFEKEETMSEDSCRYFYKCAKCGAVLRPKEGDCCVFCSYGTVKCPPKQD